MFKPTTALWQLSAPQIFKISFLSSTVAAIALTTGCSSATTTQMPNKSKQVGSDYLDADSLDSLQDLLSATDMSAVEGDRLQVLKHGDVWKRMTVGFKMDETHWDPRIEAQRNWFVSRQPYLNRMSARASRYLYHTVKEAERRGMPTELALLPVIESSYDPAATSSASAAGLWQFIPSTGRIYGLQQSGTYDARRDVVESTRAAYEFLGSLYNQFGSWELALAAYNAGPGRVQQAINRNQALGLPTDYWSLKLPQETMNYVPRFLAVAQIVKNPREYGVSLPPIANRPHFREVKVAAGVSLDAIAATAGLSRTELYSLNPGYRGDTIDPASPGRILIPSDISPVIDKRLLALKSSSGSGGFWASNNTTTSSRDQVLTPTHTTPPDIQNNTTAAAISQPSSNVSVSTTARSTSTRNSVGGSSRMPTPKGADALAAFANNADVPSAPRIPVAVTTASNVKKPISIEPPISDAEKDRIQTEIKQQDEKAETLAKVLQPVASNAEKQQVVDEIKAIAPAGTEIVDPYDGKIKLTAIQTSLSVAEKQGKEVSKSFSYPKELAESVSPDSEDAKRNQGKNVVKTDTDVVVVAPKGKRSNYKVIAGDTLAIIAMKNGVSWRDIAKWNQIDPDAPLFVGTVLYLYDAKPQQQASASSKSTRPESYTVKPNDSLTAIADQFGLSLKDLADWNNLSLSSNLMVGQKLTLKQPAESKTADTSTARNKSVKIKTKSYSVKRGEYLKVIADRYGLSVQELADLTPGLNISSNVLVGQKINVPLHEVSQSEADQPTAENDSKSVKTENYKVQSGDSLGVIASKANMSVTDLAKLNDIKVDAPIMVGQLLKVPAGSMTSETTVSSSNGTKTPEYYTVQRGDSVGLIASKYGISQDDLVEWNSLGKSLNIYPGQRLKLMGDSSSSKVSDDVADTPDTYTVKRGETLISIAKKYHLQTKNIADWNNLSVSSQLRAGQKLQLTDENQKKSNTKSSVVTTKVKSSDTANTESYAVKSGESLNAIARRYGLSTKDLADLNDMSAKAGLRLGQTILVPKLTTTYKVKSGDSLIRIANKYNMDVKQLAQMNNIEPDAQLRLGTTLQVPNS
ncbi:LysM peptidoglycan-binding domain-containing protein [Acinetobacter sp. MB5]|uniref:LysM peptidoglycan-binding domain-containing protein n=1 Tax=Acinetobacter sp. MB5 TaxID=2069438 RepID=UPI000DD0C607|nr:LysM peptidoglycan-binding domain-containing protein [Acinetobacter sp. MB5]